MIKQSIYILLIACIAFSCKSKEKKEAQKIADEISTELITGKIDEQLTESAKDSLSGWMDFQNVITDMEHYTSITKSQALENSNALSMLVKKIADTIAVDILERPDIKIRLNVLYNHSLRLDDMSTISSITDEEVALEIQKLLAAYSSLNDKINRVYKIAEFDKLFGDVQRKFSDSIKQVDSLEKVNPTKPFVPKKLTRKNNFPKNYSKD